MSLSERIAFINKCINDKGGVSLKEVCKKFEVKERTFKRDIEYLRCRIGAPVVYSRAKNIYYYSSPFDGLEFADERVLFFYVLIEKLAENHRLLPVISERILKRIREHIPDKYLPLLTCLSYEIDETEEFSPEIFKNLIHSIMNKRRVIFNYRDAKGRKSRRIIEALHILCYAGHWYCIAFDIENNEIRKFLFSRIEGLEVSGEISKSNISKLEVKRYLDSSFGIFKTGTSRDAVFRLYEPVCNIGRAQKWHPAQKIREGNIKERGSYIEISIPVGSYEEVLGKVLRYGEAAEAVAPAEFRKLWLDSIRRMADKYLKKIL